LRRVRGTSSQRDKSRLGTDLHWTGRQWTYTHKRTGTVVPTGRATQAEAVGVNFPRRHVSLYCSGCICNICQVAVCRALGIRSHGPRSWMPFVQSARWYCPLTLRCSKISIGRVPVEARLGLKLRSKDGNGNCSCRDSDAPACATPHPFHTRFNASTPLITTLNRSQ
jgi:hypothetical protein